MKKSEESADPASSYGYSHPIFCIFHFYPESVCPEDLISQIQSYTEMLLPGIPAFAAGKKQITHIGQVFFRYLFSGILDHTSVFLYVDPYFPFIAVVGSRICDQAGESSERRMQK